MKEWEMLVSLVDHLTDMIFRMLSTFKLSDKKKCYISKTENVILISS